MQKKFFVYFQKSSADTFIWFSLHYTFHNYLANQKNAGRYALEELKKYNFSQIKLNFCS